ncbi:hypothetical protein TI04_13690 [Achromatium sp. WMS2]|nr:hypothetical protein TI04_13690 [Achromatium sp. WMS2]
MIGGKNKYIIDNSLPASDSITLPDLIQIGAFSAVAVSLATVIGTESLAGMGYSATVIDNFARFNTLLYTASQLGSISYFFAA